MIVKILILNFNFNVVMIKVFFDIYIYYVNERLLFMKLLSVVKFIGFFLIKVC